MILEIVSIYFNDMKWNIKIVQSYDDGNVNH